MLDDNPDVDDEDPTSRGSPVHSDAGSDSGRSRSGRSRRGSGSESESGKNSELGTHEQGRVVLELLHGKESAQHKVYMDNYYTSP